MLPSWQQFFTGIYLLEKQNGNALAKMEWLMHLDFLAVFFI